jgi:glycerol kinase
MNADLPSPLADLRVDGGLARSDPFLQFQADLLGFPLRRSAQAESTALGAALLAGLAAGLWPAASAAIDLVRPGGHDFGPKHDPAWRKAKLSRWRHAVESVKGHYRG